MTPAPDAFSKDKHTAPLHGARFALSWDDTGVLLICDVRDDFLCPSRMELHKGMLVDGAELFLDCRDRARFGAPGYEEDVCQIALYPGTPGSAPAFFHVFNNPAQREIRLEMTARRTEVGYWLRTFIPFGSITAKGVPERIGFDLAINSADAEGKRIAQYLFAGKPDNFRNASNFRQVWLCPEAR